MGSLETLAIINPASAGGRTLRRLPEIRAALRRHGVDADIHVTTAPREATERTRTALSEGYRRVIAVGGDGTLNEVANGWFDSHGAALSPDAILGLIPSGTGGDFRRTAGISNIDAAVQILSAGQSRRLDVGLIEAHPSDATAGLRHHFINIADWGVGGEVVARVDRSRFKGGGARGSAVFLATSLVQLFSYGLREVRLTLDGHRITRRVSNVVIANGRYFGGGMQVAPRAKFDDGQFDVVLIGAMTKLQTLAGVPKLYRGSHLTMAGIELFRAASVKIEPLQPLPLRFEAEGELLGEGGATVTCLPGAIRLAVASQ